MGTPVAVAAGALSVTAFALTLLLWISNWIASFVSQPMQGALNYLSITEHLNDFTIGVLDTKQYTDERNRSWIFRTCGYGHGEEWWREFVSTLRMFGYDYVLSIEHEDSLLAPEDGLSRASKFLNGLVPKEKPAAAWWV